MDERPALLVVRVITGGQSGSDRGALDAARAAGVEHGGWCPAGGWAEGRPDPPGVLADFPSLRETRSADPAVRTRLNVRDSHATLVVRGPSTPGAASPGTELTIQEAGRLGRPLLVSAGDDEQVRAWLRDVGRNLTLHVAGPRASEDPDAYARTRRLVELLLGTR